MEAQIMGTTEGIRDVEKAKRFCQDFARICYSKLGFEDLKKEKYMKNFIEKGLLDRGHHSPFDPFKISLYIKGLPKIVAMTLNNQRVYDTNEKSARYTVMREGMEERQGQLYDKWFGFFRSEIKERFSKSKFPTLYTIGGDGKTAEEKLSQENARYMTSAFTPTKMAHTVSLRQLNILMNWFDDFYSENSDSESSFNKRLAYGLKDFSNLDVVDMWRIPNLKMKAGLPMKLLGNPVEEHFGEDVYSTNSLMSFARFAQEQRHRILTYHISGGEKLGAPLGFFVPPMVEIAGKKNEWISDLEEVAMYDFPQAQLLNISERGNREDLSAKAEERICGLVQLETARGVGNLMQKYTGYIPEMKILTEPACLRTKVCGKGGCHFGPKKALERLI